MAPGAAFNTKSLGLAAPGIRFAKWILYLAAYQPRAYAQSCSGDGYSGEVVPEGWGERLERLHSHYTGGVQKFKDFSYKHEFWYNSADGIVSLGYGHFVAGFLLMVIGWLSACCACWSYTSLWCRWTMKNMRSRARKKARDQRRSLAASVAAPLQP